MTCSKCHKRAKYMGLWLIKHDAIYSAWYFIYFCQACRIIVRSIPEESPRGRILERHRQILENWDRDQRDICRIGRRAEKQFGDIEAPR